MKAVERLPRDVVQAIKQGEIGAVLHFSPRATSVFCDLAAAAGVMEATSALVNVVISDAARDKRLPQARVAARPTLEAMVAALS